LIDWQLFTDHYEVAATVILQREVKDWPVGGRELLRGPQAVLNTTVRKNE
jgi:hypothetical protein